MPFGIQTATLVSELAAPHGLFAFCLGVAFYSTNQGDDWTEVSPAVVDQIELDNGVAVPGSDRIIAWGYAGNAASTSDHGATWTPFATSLKVVAVAAAAGGQALYVSTPTDIQVSTDGGATFMHAGPLPETMPTPRFFTADLAAPGTLFYGSQSDSVYVSRDGGATWALAFNGRANQLLQDPSNPAIEYATYNQGVFKSKDAGASWTQLSFRYGYSILAIGSHDELYVATGTRPGAAPAAASESESES